MPVPLDIAITGVLALAGIGFFFRMASRLQERTWPAPGFGKGDYVLSGILFLWWVLLIIEMLQGKEVKITPAVLVFNAVLNFCIIATICGFLVGRDRNPIRLFGLRWTDWKSGLPLVGISLAAIIPIILVVSYFAKLALGNADSTQDLLLFFKNSSSLTEKALLVFTAVVVAPVTEELVFRGYLHGVLRQIGGRWCGILVSSLIFAAIHGHIPSLAGLFVLAIAFALLYERTGSLWAPMLMHAGFNSINIIAALAWPDLMK